MTTIAYKDGIMAADTLVTNHSDGMQLRAGLPKIAVDSEGVLYGASGDYGKCCKVIETVQRQHRTGDAVILPIPEKGDNFEILVAYPDGRLRILTPDGEEVFDGHKFIAIGNGQKIAMGAMFVGASAESAVKAAIALDVGSGGEINSLMHIRHDTRIVTGLSPKDIVALNEVAERVVPMTKTLEIGPSEGFSDYAIPPSLPDNRIAPSNMSAEEEFDRIAKEG